MASFQNIQKRIRSVKAVNKITAAMELVSATKMRRAQETALNSRPYAFAAFEMLANVIEAVGKRETDFLKTALLRESQGDMHAALLVASDKGLAGTFNSAVFRKFEQFASERKEGLVIIAAGEKAKEYAERMGFSLARSFVRHGDVVHPRETDELAEFLIQEFTAGSWGKLTAFSTNFVSALKQEAVCRELLPLNFERIREAVDGTIPKTGRYAELRTRIEEARPSSPVEYLIEPSPEVALGRLVPTLFKMQIYHLILESNASEHSARRLAMKNASDNAAELTDELTSLYNRARQEQITKELLEITGAARALGA